MVDANILILELDGNIPAKKNRPRIFKRGKQFVRIPSKSHEKWHSVASYQIKMQLNNLSPNQKISLPVKKCEYIEIHLYYGSMLVKDNTNTVESIHDLLTDLGVIEDDNWRVTGETRQIPCYRKGKSGCKILIKALS